MNLAVRRSFTQGKCLHALLALGLHAATQKSKKIILDFCTRLPRYKKYICYCICMQHICNKEIHNNYVFAGHLALLVNHVIQKGTYVKAMYIGL